VPRLSEFYGIVIFMYFADHNPPHFHAVYGEHEALITVANGAVLSGGLPRTAAYLVEQRRTERQAELEANWDLAQVPAELRTIEPLR
jgi:hypothetical protein